MPEEISIFSQYYNPIAAAGLRVNEKCSKQQKDCDAAKINLCYAAGINTIFL